MKDHKSIFKKLKISRQEDFSKFYYDYDIDWVIEQLHELVTAFGEREQIISNDVYQDNIYSLLSYLYFILQLQEFYYSSQSRAKTKSDSSRSKLSRILKIVNSYVTVKAVHHLS